MRTTKGWLGWVLGAALVAGAILSWLRLRPWRERSPGRTARGGQVERVPKVGTRSAIQPSTMEGEPRMPVNSGRTSRLDPPIRARRRVISRLPEIAAILIAVAVAFGSTLLRGPSTSRPVPAVTRITAISATSVPAPRARPTSRPAATRAAVATRPAATATAFDGLSAPASETPASDPGPPANVLAAVRVGGELKGMGYNPTYATADVPPMRRADLIERDMRLMRQVGINMVLGWEPAVFDDVLLAAASANNVGVVLPFDLKPEWDYADPELRQHVMRDVSDWVVRYRDQPSVLMWGIGNEVTIEMDDAGRRTFADFYVDLFELVRALDPTRPVILREAEDVFAPYLAAAFARRQGISPEPTATDRPADAADPDVTSTPTPEDAPMPVPRLVVRAPEGFVYGVNFYTERVGPALTDWVANTGLDAPLLVSEYAPAGVGRAIRAAGFERLHELIATASPRVLGSSPYTWTTAGPEAVDDYFGLVDADGQPVDDALAAIARIYGVEPPAWAETAEPRLQIANVADLPKLLTGATSIAGEMSGRDEGDVRAAATDEATAAAEELGVEPDDEDDGAIRAREVLELIGWARELSSLRQGNRRLFPGMYEALPLLNGMARWSRGEPSAVDTARGFMAAVLRRDLAALGG